MDRISNFRPWVKKMMPTVYDDTLTYYELLTKVIGFLNQIIDQGNAIIDFMEEKTEEQDGKIKQQLTDFRRDLTETRDYFDGLVDEQNNTITNNMQEFSSEVRKLNTRFNEVQLWLENEALPTNIAERINIMFDNGQLATIINDEIFQMKADKEFVDGEIDRLDEEDENINRQLAQIMNQKPHSLLSLDRPTFVAHRGLSRLAPENTVKSLELASAKGFDWVEIDISETSDNQLVLMHDRTVDRTTDGTGETRSLTLNQIKGLTIDGGNNVDKYPGLKVPTLDNVLKVCKSLGLKAIVEIKYVSPENFESLVDLIRKHDMESDCIILVSYILYIQDFRDLSNNIAVMYLDTNVKQEIVNSLVGVGGAVGLALQTGGFTEEDVKSLQSKGIFVNVWTVNSYESVNTYKKWGIDLITTDFISEVKN